VQPKYAKLAVHIDTLLSLHDPDSSARPTTDRHFYSSHWVTRVRLAVARSPRSLSMDRTEDPQIFSARQRGRQPPIKKGEKKSPADSYITLQPCWPFVRINSLWPRRCVRAASWWLYVQLFRVGRFTLTSCSTAKISREVQKRIPIDRSIRLRTDQATCQIKDWSNSDRQSKDDKNKSSNHECCFLPNRVQSW